MILVISKTNDISTDYFIEWCDYLDIPVIRTNEQDMINPTEQICLGNGLPDIAFVIKGTKYRLAEIDAVWFRRGYIYHYEAGVGSLDDKRRPADMSSVDEFLANENKTLNDFFIHCLRRKDGINEPDRYNANKLICLLSAAEAGLDIPFTLIAKDRNTVNTYFPLGQEQVITKPIQDSLYVGYEDRLYNPPVVPLNPARSFPEHFFYSKFQKGIDKKFEVRTFFLKSLFFSCAIFTPDIVQDYQELRIVPFKLPETVKQKIEQLADTMGYESGSIDLLVDQENKYYFLEINPVGQYDFVSRNCNYYLDYEIAKFFKKNYGKPAIETRP